MSWMLLGGFAFLFAGINLVRAITGKKQGWELLMLLSLSCGVFALVAEYQMIGHWAMANDWSAIGDVAPYMADALLWVAILGVVLNFAAALLHLRKNK